MKIHFLAQISLVYHPKFYINNRKIQKINLKCIKRLLHLRTLINISTVYRAHLMKTLKILTKLTIT
jgi:hypothetical protein